MGLRDVSVGQIMDFNVIFTSEDAPIRSSQNDSSNRTSSCYRVLQNGDLIGTIGGSDMLSAIAYLAGKAQEFSEARSVYAPQQ